MSFARILALTASALCALTACSPVATPDGGTGGGAAGGTGGTGGGAGGGSAGGTAGTGGGSAGGGGAVDLIIVSTMPTSGSNQVATSTAISIDFSKAVKPASVAVSLAPSVALGTPVMSNGDTTATVTPTAQLAPNTSYTVTVAATDLNDVAVTGPLTFTFMTAGPTVDTTPPTVTSTTPANMATNVAVAGLRVIATFSEAVQPSSIATMTTGGDFELGAPTMNGTNTVATFSTLIASDGGVGAFQPSTMYSFSLRANDTAGNAMVAPYVFGFTTAVPVDTTPPAVAAVLPGDGSTAVALNSALFVTFSEPMNQANTQSALRINGATRAGTFAWNAAGTVLRFLPTAGWMASTNFAITFGPGAADLVGNTLGGFTSTFTTGTGADTVIPSLVSSNPTANQQTFVPLTGCMGRRSTAPLTFVFNDAMDLVATEAAFTVLRGTTPVPGVLASSGGGRNLSFTPTTRLDYDTVYTVRIGSSPTFASDVAGNPLATLNFTFKTIRLVDVTLPVLTTQSGRILSGAAGAAPVVQLDTAIRAGEFGEAATATVFSRGVVTFPLTPMPASSGCVVHTDLSIEQVGVNGAPFGAAALGDAVVEIVDMGPPGAVYVDASDYSAAATGTAVTVSNAALPGTRIIDITTLFQTLFESASRNNFRFRVRFTNTMTSSGAIDSVLFQNTTNNPSLRVSVEAP